MPLAGVIEHPFRNLMKGFLENYFFKCNHLHTFNYGGDLLFWSPISSIAWGNLLKFYCLGQCSEVRRSQGSGVSFFLFFFIFMLLFFQVVTEPCLHRDHDVGMAEGEESASELESEEEDSEKGKRKREG